MKMSKLFSLVVALLLLMLVNTNVAAGVVYLDQNAAIGRGWMQVQKDLKSWGLSDGDRVLKPFAVPLYLCFKAGESQLVTLKTGNPEDCSPFISGILKVNKLSTDRGLTLEEFRNRISDGLVFPSDEWLVTQTTSLEAQAPAVKPKVVNSAPVVAATPKDPTSEEQAAMRQELQALKQLVEGRPDAEKFAAVIQRLDKLERSVNASNKTSAAGRLQLSERMDALLAEVSNLTIAGLNEQQEEGVKELVAFGTEALEERATGLEGSIVALQGDVSEQGILLEGYEGRFVEVESRLSEWFWPFVIAVAIVVLAIVIMAVVFGRGDRKLGRKINSLGLNHNDLYTTVNGDENGLQSGLKGKVKEIEQSINNPETGLAAAHREIDETQRLTADVADFDWCENNPTQEELEKLGVGREHQTVYRFTRTSTGEQFQVWLWREKDTPKGLVCSSVFRNKDRGDLLADPFSVKTSKLHLRLAQAVQGGRIESEKPAVKAA